MIGRRQPRGVRLPAAVRRAIVTHARRERPRECCGLLIGRRGASVEFAVAMNNVARIPTRHYRVDDAQHIELRRLLRQLTPPVRIVGVYHSHPSGAPVPSEDDVRQAFYADWIHLIVGFRAGRAAISAWRIRRGRATRLPI